MTFSRFSCLAALPLLLATSAMAQVFPTRADGPVTDDAQLLDDAVEAQLVARLNALREQGTALDVVTLPNMDFYTMGVEIPEYTARLAENFALTEQADGKWGLVLVFPEDRQVRTAVGPAFTDQTSTVDSIVADVMRPAFQNNAYGEGLSAGVDALITQVMAPSSALAAAAEVPTDSGGKGLYWLLGGLVVVVGGIVALVKRGNAKLAATPCASCGKTGLTRNRVTLVEPTFKTEGSGEDRLTCPSCGHVVATPYTIPKKRAEGRQQTTETAGKTVAVGAAVGAAAVAGAAVANAKHAAPEPEAPRTKPGMQGHKDEIQEQADDDTSAVDRTQSGGASASW